MSAGSPEAAREEPIAWVLLDEVPDQPEPIGVFSSHAQAVHHAKRLKLQWYGVIGVPDYRMVSPCSG